MKTKTLETLCYILLYAFGFSIIFGGLALEFIFGKILVGIGIALFICSLILNRIICKRYEENRA